MILYFTIIGIAILLVSIFNIAFNLTYLQCQWWMIIILAVVGVIFQFAVDALSALIVSKTPDKWYNPEKKIFDVSAKEIKVMDFFQIKHWKDKIWELGGLGGFSKKKVDNPNDIKYIRRFLIEINRGQWVHIVGMFIGYLLLLVYPTRFLLAISLPIAIVNMFLNFLPILALRYNYPRLKKIYTLLSRRANKD